jgi:hypothetical protein
MIDQKYLELFNKDIDKTISNSEKELLKQYFKSNPKADALHKDLFKTESLLDKLPDNEPSASLKQRILNSIDYNRYSNRKKKLNVIDYFTGLFTGPRKRIATSFAFGMISGIIILSVIFYTSYYNSSELNNVYGTIGFHDSEVFESVEVNSMDITGEIEISKVTNHYKVDVNLKSSEKYTLQIDFDQANLKIDNLSLTELKNIQIEKGFGSIKLIGSDNSPYSLLLTAKELSPDKLMLKILRNNNRLFEREIILSNN